MKIEYSICLSPESVMEEVEYLRRDILKKVTDPESRAIVENEFDEFQETLAIEFKLKRELHNIHKILSA